MGLRSNVGLKNRQVHLAPQAHDLPMVSHVRAKIIVKLHFLYWRVFFLKKMVVYYYFFFFRNNGEVRESRLVVAPTIEGILN